MTLPVGDPDSVESANTWTAFVLTVGYLIAASAPCQSVLFATRRPREARACG